MKIVYSSCNLGRKSVAQLAWVRSSIFALSSLPFVPFSTISKHFPFHFFSYQYQNFLLSHVSHIRKREKCVASGRWNCFVRLPGNWSWRGHFFKRPLSCLLPLTVGLFFIGERRTTFCQRRGIFCQWLLCHYIIFFTKDQWTISCLFLKACLFVGNMLRNFLHSHLQWGWLIRAFQLMGPSNLASIIKING